VYKNNDYNTKTFGTGDIKIYFLALENDHDIIYYGLFPNFQVDCFLNYVFNMKSNLRSCRHEYPQNDMNECNRCKDKLYNEEISFIRLLNMNNYSSEICCVCNEHKNGSAYCCTHCNMKLCQFCSKNIGTYKCPFCLIILPLKDCSISSGNHHQNNLVNPELPPSYQNPEINGNIPPNQIIYNQPNYFSPQLLPFGISDGIAENNFSSPPSHKQGTVNTPNRLTPIPKVNRPRAGLPNPTENLEYINYAERIPNPTENLKCTSCAERITPKEIEKFICKLCLSKAKLLEEKKKCHHEDSKCPKCNKISIKNSCTCEPAKKAEKNCETCQEVLKSPHEDCKQCGDCQKIKNLGNCKHCRKLIYSKIPLLPNILVNIQAPSKCIQCFKELYPAHDKCKTCAACQKVEDIGLCNCCNKIMYSGKTLEEFSESILKDLQELNNY
jgi:hypothetical protein